MDPMPDSKGPSLVPNRMLQLPPNRTSSAKRSSRCNLPKLATSILKDWLLGHWHDPYPTEKEKLLLAQATNLKIEQVNNWLINARRRILPGICDRFGLDHSQRKIARRGGNRHVEGAQPYWKGKDLWKDVSKVDSVSTFVHCGRTPHVHDSPEHPVMLDYLADVMLVSEELEKSPNREGLSRLEVLCSKGLGERLLYVCSP